MSEYGNGNCLALVEVCALLSATLVYSGTKANLNFHKTGSSVSCTPLLYSEEDSAADATIK